MPGAVANSQPWAAGTSSAAASGLNTHTTAASALIASPSAAAAPPADTVAGSRSARHEHAPRPEPGEREHDRRRHQRRDPPALQRQRLGQHGPARRVDARRSARAAGSTARRAGTAAVAAATHPIQRSTGSRRRRAPKNASIAASSGGSSSVPTSSRIAQSGSRRRTVMMPPPSSAKGPSSLAARDARVERDDGAHRRAAEGVEAVLRHRRARARPALAGRLEQHGGQPAARRLALLGDGQRQRPPRPLADRARAARLHADLAPDRALERAAEPHRGGVAVVGPGDDPGLVDAPCSRGRRARSRRRSGRRRRSRRTRAPRRRRALPPEVETSTSVEERSRTLNTRASSSSAAVPDSSASAGEPRASRCAITTIRRLDSPGRTPTTVSSSALAVDGAPASRCCG